MSDHTGKQVKAVVEIGPNYAFHLMAAARVGFDSEYADKYHDSVLPDDLEFIRKHKDVLTFGGSSTSELVGPIIAWPAYFNLDTKEALQEYFALLDIAAESNDFLSFLDRYAPHIEKLEKWWYTINEELLKIFIPQREFIKSLGEILIRNFDAYLKTVWDKEQPGMLEVAGSINDYFGQYDRIGQWEEITGMAFEFPVYNIVLCSAIKNGPNANSLGYDRVIFYPDSSLEQMVEFISHEIGTHILIGMLKEVANMKKFEFTALYEGYELLARHYNTLILNKSPLSYPKSTFHVDEYLEIYMRLHEEMPELSPRDRLLKGIEEFQNSAASR